MGDRAYVVYSGPERMQAQKRKENTKQTLTTLFAVAALLGVVAVADGEATSDAPVGVTSHLFQQAPGDEALIRVSVPNRSVPLREQIHAWLFFRGDGQQFFSLTAENLVAIRTEPRLPGGIWDDSPVASGPFEYDLEFDYLTSEGDEETIDLTAEFMHPALQVGHTYYHRVQRIVDPMERAGSGAPIATTQVRPAQVTVDYELEIDPPDALSEGSKPTNGVTYFTPPILVSQRTAPPISPPGKSPSRGTQRWCQRVCPAVFPRTTRTGGATRSSRSPSVTTPPECCLRRSTSTSIRAPASTGGSGHDDRARRCPNADA